MLQCPSCLALCLRAVVNDAPVLSRSALRTPSRLIPRSGHAPPVSRSYATATATTRNRRGTTREEYEQRSKTKLGHLREKHESGRFVPLNVPGRKSRAPVPRSQRFDTDFELTAKEKKDLELELRYLKDPLKLANHVHQVLRSNDAKKALSLVRTASGEMQCIVGWNHCIDWLLSRGEVKAALKAYNEVCI